MKIGEARQIYGAQIKEYQEQKLLLSAATFLGRQMEQ